ncbi:hypothetical protein DP115_28685 [Brasilonema octagenarum UFV-OR1]|nr:hypothetical protein [Brasilonema octagenarum UFV-OR1]
MKSAIALSANTELVNTLAKRRCKLDLLKKTLITYKSCYYDTLSNFTINTAKISSFSSIFTENLQRTDHVKLDTISKKYPKKIDK